MTGPTLMCVCQGFHQAPALNFWVKPHAQKNYFWVAVLRIFERKLYDVGVVAPPGVHLVRRKAEERVEDEHGGEVVVLAQLLWRHGDGRAAPRRRRHTVHHHPADERRMSSANLKNGKIPVETMFSDILLLCTKASETINYAV